jgi:hypothetical protein
MIQKLGERGRGNNARGWPACHFCAAESSVKRRSQNQITQNYLKNRGKSREELVLARNPKPTSPAVAQATVFPKENGAPEEIRTPDPQIRSLVLYPAELRVRI